MATVIVEVFIDGIVGGFPVVMHEIGHELGLADLVPEAGVQDLMVATLQPGTRRMQRRDANGTSDVFTSTGTNALIATLSRGHHSEAAST